MHRPKSRTRSVFLIAVLALPAVYFFSIGPFFWASQGYAGWLESRNQRSVVWLDPATQQWRSAKGSPDYHSQFEDVTGLLYAPVFLVAGRCEPLEAFLFWYMNLFGDV